jgi:hypothetical protein
LKRRKSYENYICQCVFYSRSKNFELFSKIIPYTNPTSRSKKTLFSLL